MRPMLHCRVFLPRPSRRLPEAAPTGGADSVHGKERFGSVERVRDSADAGRRAARGAADEILARMRELVEKDGGSWDGHEPWGRRKLAYEIGHKGEGTTTWCSSRRPGDAGRDLARPEDHRRRHAPPRRDRVKGGQTKAPRRRSRPALSAVAVSLPADDADAASE